MKSPPVEVICGDITRLEVDAVVNAANRSLLGGGGVDGAIHRAAGPRLLEACRRLGGCPAGEVRITPGFDLPARWIIHTVGPVYHGGDRGEKQLLQSAYANSLQLCITQEIGSIAFPAISTGAYGYPAAEADRIAIETVLTHFAGELGYPSRVCFVLWGDQRYREFLATWTRSSGHS